jgi:glycosyltransferase involved in cell wall biosynthesis
LFRKEAINKIEGYENRIFMYGEDVELSYRLRDNGYKLKYYPKAVCWHYTYEEEHEVKPIQFLGSALANVYIRLRYGSLMKIIQGYILFLSLFFLPKQFPSQRKDLLKYLWKLIKNTPYFLATRKKNKKQEYKMLYGDYEFIRDGAFYEYSEKVLPYKPLVSVVVRTCCGKIEYLKEAITSIQNQTYENIEVVIVEDGTNDTKSYVNTIEGLKIQYKSIHKSGRCKAGNVALEMTTGEYIVFLDDDDLFFADHLEILVNELVNNKDISAAYSNAYEVKTDEKSRSPLEYEEKEFNVMYRQDFSRCLMWHNNYIPIQSILFSRKLYEKHGGFDEDLENLEDWNLWTRYSIEDDFKYVEKTTSLYRVPFNTHTSVKRYAELDSYYEKAVEKQKSLKIELSPADVIKYHHELNKNFQFFAVTKNGIRGLMIKIPFFHKFYSFGRKVSNKIVKMRNEK